MSTMQINFRQYTTPQLKALLVLVCPCKHNPQTEHCICSEQQQASQELRYRERTQHNLRLR